MMKDFFPRKTTVTLLLIFCSFLLTHLCFYFLPGIFEIWNAKAVDHLFSIRAASQRLRPPYDNTVVHVDLNNSSIRQLGQAYINRSNFAAAVRNLSEMDTACQVYDFVFYAAMDTQGDRAFIKAVRDAENAYFGMAVELDRANSAAPEDHRSLGEFPAPGKAKWHVRLQGQGEELWVGKNPHTTFTELAEASRGLGSLSVHFDRDGVLRRVPLLVRYENGFLPILPFRAVCDYLGVQPRDIILRPGKHVILKGARKPGEKTSHDIIIPIDRLGNMIVNYAGPWGWMDHYNFADIVSASNDRHELDLWREELSGKIVVISDLSTGSTDLGPVPTDPNFPLSGVHANVINNILTERFLRELSFGKMLIIECLMMAVVLVLALRFSSLYFSLGALLTAGTYIGTMFSGFLIWDVILHLIRPIFMLTGATISIVVYYYIKEEREKIEGLRQRDFIRAVFGRYISREVVEEILNDPDGLKLSGEVREITILVSDLRGFTALSGRLPPHEVINILNRFFETMVDIIRRFNGSVNEFHGDGILSFFGAPLHYEDDAERAVACAIEMQKAMEGINQYQRRFNLPELAMGIGISRGDVVVGNIGSEKRAKYGAVGAPINTAFRIESYTSGGQILICPDTYAKIRPLLRIKGTIEGRFKGIPGAMTLYDVFGMEGDYQDALPEQPAETMADLETPLPIQYSALSGKIVSEISHGGHITLLGEKHFKALLTGRVERYDNLKIRISSPDAGGFSDAYAKILSIDRETAPPGPSAVHLVFTWLPGDVKAFLKKYKEHLGSEE